MRDRHGHPPHFCGGGLILNSQMKRPSPAKGGDLSISISCEANFSFLLCSSRPPSEWKLRSTNMLRIMHRVCGSLPAALLLIGRGHNGILLRQPEARQACMPDAMRLCSEFTSDVSQTTKCMMAKRGQLSAACRMAMAHGNFPPRVSRYYLHYRHCTHVHCAIS